MTVQNDITKLDNYEDEDIFDVVQKLEKSFGLQFENDAFYNVQTFGDLCDIFTNKLQGDNLNDCTTQQAFYKVRNAIATTQLIDPKSLTLETKLQDIFQEPVADKKFKNYKVS